MLYIVATGFLLAPTDNVPPLPRKGTFANTMWGLDYPINPPAGPEFVCLRCFLCVHNSIILLETSHVLPVTLSPVTGRERL
jgi:hypothetical protein